MDVDELEYSADRCYWESCVKAIAENEMNIMSIQPHIRNQMQEDVEYYQIHGVFRGDD
jgi:hypothetical protein